MRLRTEIFSPGELEQIHTASLQILDGIGVEIRHEAAKKRLIAIGCRDNGGRITMPPRIVETALHEVQRGFDLYGWDMSHRCHLDADAFLCRPSDGLPFIYDAITRRRQPATMDDAERIVRLLDALDQFDIVNAVVSPAAFGVGIKNIHRFVTAIRNSTKPTDITISGPEEVRIIAEIARTIRGGHESLVEKPLVMAYVSPISPLIFPEVEIEAIWEVARAGIPLELLPCPMLGLTAPVTIAGALVQHNAEHLAMIVLVHLVRPDLPVCCCTRLAPTDMRTGLTSYGGPELGMTSVAAAQMAHYYDLPINGYGFGTSSRVLNQQSGYERMQSALLACLGGINLMTGGGSLDDTLTTSTEQLVIDNELIGRLRYIQRGSHVNDEMLGLDVLRRCCINGEFLSDDHTVHHLLEGDVWGPTVSNREPYTTWQDNPEDLVEHAGRVVEDLLRTHRPIPWPADLDQAVQRIVEKGIGFELGA